MPAPIAVKPHHFVDILTALGAGTVEYAPHPYGHDLHAVAKRVLEDPGVGLTVELGADAICRPCVHNVDGLCDDTIDTSFRPAAPRSKREWNLLIDRRWCERLDVAQGQTLTARELCRRIQSRMGDLAGIYREAPADRTRKRRDDLEKGVRVFLGLAPRGGAADHPAG